MPDLKSERRPLFALRHRRETSIAVAPLHVDVCFVVLRLRKQPPVLTDVDALALA